MAEGQRARSQALSCRPPPPPPAKWNWRSGSYFPRETHVLGPSRCHLAEGVSRRHLTKNGLDCASTRAATCAWRWSGGKSGWQVSLPTISALAKFSDLLMACQFISYVELPATLPLCHALGNDAIVAKLGQPPVSPGEGRGEGTQAWHPARQDGELAKSQNSALSPVHGAFAKRVGAALMPG